MAKVTKAGEIGVKKYTAEIHWLMKVIRGFYKYTAVADKNSTKQTTKVSTEKSWSLQVVTDEESKECSQSVVKINESFDSRLLLSVVTEGDN